MFNNIGRKIKGLAKTLFWILTIISMIAGFLVIVFTFNEGGESSILAILAGIGIAVGGFILAWLQNFLLYGFGELIDSNQKILKVLEEKKEEVRPPVAPVQPPKPEPEPEVQPTNNF